MLRSENKIVFPFEKKGIIFSVVQFVDYFSQLGRRIKCVQSFCLFAIKYVEPKTYVPIHVKPSMWKHTAKLS